MAATFSGFVKVSGQTNNLDLEEQKRHPVRWAEDKTYRDGVLIYNWNEDKFDVKSISKLTPLPSQYGQYFHTTYKQSFSKGQPKVPDLLNYPSELRASDVAFPSHQRVMDTPHMKAQCCTYKTTSMEYGKTYHGKPTLTSTTENHATQPSTPVATPLGPSTSSSEHSMDKPSSAVPTRLTPSGGSDGL